MLHLGNSTNRAVQPIHALLCSLNERRARKNAVEMHLQMVHIRIMRNISLCIADTKELIVTERVRMYLLNPAE